MLERIFPLHSSSVYLKVRETEKETKTESIEGGRHLLNSIQVSDTGDVDWTTWPHDLLQPRQTLAGSWSHSRIRNQIQVLQYDLWHLNWYHKYFTKCLCQDYSFRSPRLVSIQQTSLNRTWWSLLSKYGICSIVLC